MKYPLGLLFILLFSMLSFSSASSQGFLRAGRLFVGIKGGVNFTQPIPLRSYQVFAPTPNSTNGVRPKEYANMFNNLGGQVGMGGLYYFNQSIALAFQLMYFNYNFSYTNRYTWNDTISGGPVNADYTHKYKLSYFEVPLMLRYDILPGRFSPFLQAGGFFGVLGLATHNVAYSTSYDIPVGPGGSLPETPATSIKQNLNAVSAGIIGGVGLAFNTDYVQIGLEVNARYGLVPITNPRNRFSDAGGGATGYYDVMDDIQLFNLEISLTALFPIGPGSGTGGSKPYCSFESKPKKFKKRRR